MPVIDADADTCDMPDVQELDSDGRWVTINVHGRAQSIEEGILVPYQFSYEEEMIDCCLSDTLWERYRYDQSQLKQILQIGVRLLQKRTPTDTEYAKRRVIIPGEVWVVEDRDGLMYLKPEDY